MATARKKQISLTENTNCAIAAGIQLQISGGCQRFIVSAAQKGAPYATGDTVIIFGVG